MGELAKKIAEDLKESMKNRDDTRLSTLRMIIASMQYLTIEKKTSVADDSDILKIIAKQVKQHQDSIESFKKGNRPELVEKEKKELEILKSYLPKQLSETEISDAVKKVLADIGPVSKSDFGKVMKLAMEELKGQADGKTVSSVVQKILQQ